MTATTKAALRETVSTACRVLAREGLVNGVLGHVSARTGPDELLIRCRGPQERGLRRTTPDEVWSVTTDGDPVDVPDGFNVPNEAPIHTELMRQRADVGAVVHAHPPSALLFGLAGLELKPIIGAYNIPAMQLAIDGVPVYSRPVLISRRELAEELLTVMEDSDACLMVGHGITVAGRNVEDAVVRALNLTVLMDITVNLAQLGVVPTEIHERDLQELPDLGSQFNAEFVWNSLVAEMESEDACGGCDSAHQANR